MTSAFLTDDINSLYFRYLIPSLGGALATSIYSFVDTIAVGQACGPDGAAAIAIINPFFAIMCFIGLLFGIGGSVLMSHCKGEGREHDANRIFSTSFVLVASAGTAAWIASAIFIDDILIFSGADSVLLPYARSYIIPIVVSFPLFVFNTYIAPMIRYDEEPSLVMKAVLTGGIFNIFGDWFFVFPLGMDMFGAGLATAIGALIQTLIYLSHFIRKHSSLKLMKDGRLKENSRRITATGFGASILDVAIAVLTIIINKQTMRYGGRDELAVLGVIMTISFLFQHIYAGIGQAVQPIASTNFGAGLRKRTWKSFSLMFWTSAAFGLASMLISVCFPSAILRLFMDASGNVIAIGPHIVTIYGLSFSLMAMNINIVFFLQAVMKPFPAMIFSASRGIAVSALLLYILPIFFGMDGILWAMVTAEIATAMIAIPYTLMVRKAQLS